MFDGCFYLASSYLRVEINHVDVKFATRLSKVEVIIGLAVAASAATDKFLAQSGNSANSG